MASFAQLAKKLQSAINQRTGVKGTKLLINTQQWFSEDKGRPVTIFTIKRRDIDLEGRKSTVELFKTYSQIQMVLWLRDYWYELNDWELPTDNPIWEEMKRRNEEKAKDE